MTDKQKIKELEARVKAMTEYMADTMQILLKFKRLLEKSEFWKND